jgi:hypothetical protein
LFDKIFFLNYLQQTIFLFRRALFFFYCIENHNYKILFLEKERNKLIKKDISKTKNILHECALQYDQFYLSNKVRRGILNNLKSSKNNYNIDFFNNLIINSIDNASIVNQELPPFFKNVCLILIFIII